MKAPKPGDLLDNRYLIVRSLAAGGFGQTYIAEDTRRPGNPVCVVKHLVPASSDPKFLENATRLFLTEAQTLEKLGIHDQIPRLLAYFEEHQEFYLVQDWIDGFPLTHELLPGQRWPESKVCQMLQEVLSILQFVHSFGVIHRDIKPDNIIRRRQDNKLVLVDFGIVKQIRTQMLTPGQMNVNATIAIGTPGYMPTEQGRGNPRPNSDIYALGIIAIQSVTGLNPTQLQEDPQTGEIIWQPWAQISQELNTILDIMVRYHFKDRYQSATEALTALEPLITRFSLPSLNSVVTPSGQVIARSHPNQVSSSLDAVPVNEPSPTQVSISPIATPVNEPQVTPDSLVPSPVPVNEPSPTQVSISPIATPVNEPQVTPDSLVPSPVPVNELSPTQVSISPIATPVNEPQVTPDSLVPSPVPVNEPSPTQVSLPPVILVNEPQPTQISLPPVILVNEPQPTQVSRPPIATPVNEPQLTQASLQPPEKANSVVSYIDPSPSPKDLQLSYVYLLRQAAIFGSGSWLLVIFLTSMIGIIWLGTTFWLIILGCLIFGYFAKYIPQSDRSAIFGITVFSSAVTFLFWPRGILSSTQQSIQSVILVVFLLALFAGALAFILIILSGIFETYQE
ncbi:serine/threonine-protein kinase [Nostoc sp. FACHB-145]|uniref:serine/threonine-protein kinase n=1 Tax=Nostoc sp. FACHB-145 TaxID=2692836 RepID=UPI0016859681|nr:serine/threonine-protein kinase [Nostoc sp. FACHB-145]MBD2471916.1 protein kinase [Nostoc sp. FACHB-145]